MLRAESQPADCEQHYLELCCLLIGNEARAKYPQLDEPISEELFLAKLKDNREWD